MKQLSLCLLLLALFPLRVFSQIDTLSLPQAIELAKKNNATITIAEVGIKQSEIHLHEARVTRYPALFFHSHLLRAPEKMGMKE